MMGVCVQNLFLHFFTEEKVIFWSEHDPKSYLLGDELWEIYLCLSVKCTLTHVCFFSALGFVGTLLVPSSEIAIRKY